MPTRANRDTNSYGMKVGNGAQAPHTEIEDRICLNISHYVYTKIQAEFVTNRDERAPLVASEAIRVPLGHFASY